MILYPSRRGFIVEIGVPRTRTCRSRRAAALPPPAGIRSFTCWSEHETEVAADGRRACEWATVLWSAAPLFFSLIGMQAEAGQGVHRPERRGGRERATIGARKGRGLKAAYETEHRPVTVGEILSAVPLTIGRAEKCAR